MTFKDLRPGDVFYYATYTYTCKSVSSVNEEGRVYITTESGELLCVFADAEIVYSVKR